MGGVGGLDAVFSVLSTDSRFKVVTSPSLRVRSGESAKLSVGSDVPVLGAVSITSTGQPVQSVEYRSSGVILDLKPQVLVGGVQLQIGQQVSGFVVTSTGVNSSPTLLKRELSTSITVRPDEVVFLAGLDEDKDSGSTSGLPWDFIPSFFRSKSSERSRTELLLMIEARPL